jgi:hypothetical protein
MVITLEAYRHDCVSYSHAFDAMQLPDPPPYGIFLMRSTSGRLALLNSLDDIVFQAAIDWVEAGHLTEPRRTPSVHLAFEATCDEAEDGTRYHIGMTQVCPRCGGATRWKSTGKFHSQDVSAVTHSMWSRLTETEKRALWQSAVDLPIP